VNARIRAGGCDYFAWFDQIEKGRSTPVRTLNAVAVPPLTPRISTCHLSNAISGFASMVNRDEPQVRDSSWVAVTR